MNLEQYTESPQYFDAKCYRQMSRPLELIPSGHFVPRCLLITPPPAVDYLYGVAVSISRLSNPSLSPLGRPKVGCSVQRRPIPFLTPVL